MKLKQNQIYDCLACGSEEVNPSEQYYFVSPVDLIAFPCSYLLCKEHKHVRYYYDDLFDENNKQRKVIDHKKVIERSKKLEENINDAT